METTSRPGSDEAAGNGDRNVGLSGAGAADQHQVAPLSQEAAAGQILYQGIVDRGAFELKSAKSFASDSLR